MTQLNKSKSDKHGQTSTLNLASVRYSLESIDLLFLARVW